MSKHASIYVGILESGQHANEVDKSVQVILGIACFLDFVRCKGMKERISSVQSSPSASVFWRASVKYGFTLSFVCIGMQAFMTLCWRRSSADTISYGLFPE